MTTKEQHIKEMEKEFFDAAKKLALMLVEQASAAGIDEYLLGAACDMVSNSVRQTTEKALIEEFGSMEEAEKIAMKRLEEHLQAEEKMKETKGQKIVDIAIAKAQGKTIH